MISSFVISSCMNNMFALCPSINHCYIPLLNFITFVTAIFVTGWRSRWGTTCQSIFMLLWEYGFWISEKNSLKKTVLSIMKQKGNTLKIFRSSKKKFGTKMFGLKIGGTVKCWWKTIMKTPDEIYHLKTNSTLKQPNHKMI